MANPIDGLGSLNSLFKPFTMSESFQNTAANSGEIDFQKLLLEALSETSAAEQAAKSAVEQYQIDGGTTKSEVFVEMKKAELALRLTMQIRNKVLEAYEEIKQMRM